MPSFIRRTGAVSCFFCQSRVTPANPRSFRCPQCNCWNRYDASGEIMSDEPAMHDETLNATSFARRASPDKNRFLSTYTTGQFCHTCQTNQMLLVNLLSNYLPHPQHPDYARRLEQLPAYRESLHIRYPPVCAQCSPAVQDEIKRKDQMARTQALAGFLKDTKGKDTQRRVSATGKEWEKLESKLTIWRLRGALWWITLLCVMACHSAVVLGYNFPHILGRIAPFLPLVAFFSLFYTAWDPTYYTFKKARIQGRDVRVRGKGRYIALQLTAWFSRLVTSVLLASARYRTGDHSSIYLSVYTSSHRIRTYCSALLLLEVMIFVTSFAMLHLQRPPSIRLIDTSPSNHIHPHSSRATPERSSATTTTRSSSVPVFPTHTEPDLTALSLSPKPVVPQSSNPIFGMPSLLSTASAPPTNMDDIPDENAMDWTPTNPSPSKSGRKSVNDEDGSWLRPQRFFPPEQPTGLETLFAGTKLEDADNKPTDAHGANTGTWIWQNHARNAGIMRNSVWRWLGGATVVLVVLGAIAHQRWTWNSILTDRRVVHDEG
ncbi:Ima1 N-terminal domain-containing protein [Pisolithus marmoratus]|nr:Ima1 N-terminal domain-containing protein [Pisolithus marmoratus]